MFRLKNISKEKAKTLAVRAWILIILAWIGILFLADNKPTKILLLMIPPLMILGAITLQNIINAFLGIIESIGRSFLEMIHKHFPQKS